jgi:hypothetical protein
MMRRSASGWSTTTPTRSTYSRDGKQLLQTLGTPNVPGADGTHFNRPTFIAWLPDGTFFVADGYNGTRVAKFDASGKFLLDFGKSGEPEKETRPGYMWASTFRPGVCSSTIATTTASRSSTRTASISPSGKSP